MVLLRHTLYLGILGLFTAWGYSVCLSRRRDIELQEKLLKQQEEEKKLEKQTCEEEGEDMLYYVDIEWD